MPLGGHVITSANMEITVLHGLLHLAKNGLVKDKQSCCKTMLSGHSNRSDRLKMKCVPILPSNAIEIIIHTAPLHCSHLFTYNVPTLNGLSYSHSLKAWEDMIQLDGREYTDEECRTASNDSQFVLFMILPKNSKLANMARPSSFYSHTNVVS